MNTPKQQKKVMTIYERYKINERIRKQYEKRNEENKKNWVESLGKHIIESVTLEIGNPIDDGYNYIKQKKYVVR